MPFSFVLATLSFFLVSITVTANAYPNSDDTIFHIGSGTAMVAQKDVLIPANSSGSYISSNVPGDYVRCFLLYPRSVQERVILKGTRIVFSGVNYHGVFELNKEGTGFKLNEQQVSYDSLTISSPAALAYVTCYDGFSPPSISEMSSAIQPAFKLEFPTPTPIASQE